MKSLFGTNRRKALSQTFLNVFTLLISSVFTTELFTKFPLVYRIAAWIFIASVLISGWLLIPEKAKATKGEI